MRQGDAGQGARIDAVVPSCIRPLRGARCLRESAEDAVRRHGKADLIRTSGIAILGRGIFHTPYNCKLNVLASRYSDGAALEWTAVVGTEKRTESRRYCLVPRFSHPHSVGAPCCAVRSCPLSSRFPIGHAQHSASCGSHRQYINVLFVCTRSPSTPRMGFEAQRLDRDSGVTRDIWVQVSTVERAGLHSAEPVRSLQPLC